MGRMAAVGLGLVGALTAVTIACGDSADPGEVIGPSDPGEAPRIKLPFGEAGAVGEGGTTTDTDGGMTGATGDASDVTADADTSGATGDAGSDVTADADTSGATGDAGSDLTPDADATGATGDAGTSSGDPGPGSGSSSGGDAPVSSITNPPVTVPGSSGQTITPGATSGDSSSCTAVPGRTQTSGSAAIVALALGTALVARRRRK